MPLASSSPLVTVVITTYDRPAMLKQALASALAQTYRNIEVIVSDDGTNPDTPTVVASMQDPRVRYRHNPVNLGEIRNNQVVYREALGKYISNLHDDDLWTPTFLEKLVPHLEKHPEASLAFCDHYIANPDGSFDLPRTNANTRRYGRHALSPGLHQPFWQQALLKEQVPIAMASVFRASSFDPDDLRVEARSSYDKWIGYLLCRNGQAAYYHPERLTAYRIHDGQESARSFSGWAEGELFCLEAWAEDPRLSSIADQLSALAHQKRVDLGKELLREGRAREARPHLMKALRKAFSRAALLLLIGLLPGSLPQQVMRMRDTLRRRNGIRPSLSSASSPSLLSK